MPLLDPCLCLCCALEAARVPIFICREPKKQQPQPQPVHGVPTDT
jgi:hypothetical protein|eukprot:COSAG01_NODE_2563_length_7449_cov_10.912517_4_plen_45_part_00